MFPDVPLEVPRLNPVVLSREIDLLGNIGNIGNISLSRSQNFLKPY